MNHDSHHQHHNGHDNHSEHNHDTHAGHNPDAFKKKFWLSLALTIPALLFSHTIQGWLGFNLSFAGSEYIPAILGTVIFFYGGLVFLKSAKDELASHKPGMMTLISMAISVSFIYSLLVTFRVVQGMDFWWELATLVTIMLLGHWLEMASVKNAQGALQELAKLLPDEAERIINGKPKKVATADLRTGDTILIRPGAQVPADGVVIDGNSNVNESMLTGESRLQVKTVGSSVTGGTINTTGALTVKVQHVGSETALAGIIKLVDEAQKSTSRSQVLADKAAFLLTFVAIGAAIATGIGWMIAGASTDFILERIVTVLVVACPHALGLAIPLVTAISTTLAAKQGILVRKRLALETARTIDVVIFDKTGTLTTGNQGVVSVHGDNTEKITTYIAALEAQSEHPIAEAVTQYSGNRKLPTVKNFKSMPGRGVSAIIDGVLFQAGGTQLLSELKLTLSSSLKVTTNKASAAGQSTIYLIENGSVIGAIVIADVIREESAEAVQSLQKSGKRVVMLTGDSDGVAAWVADELGIKEYTAGVLPEHKAAFVENLQMDGSKVAMVGDGVNDAPALAQADIGIAIGAGTDVAIESADIVLASSDPRGVSKIVNLSKKTYVKMWQNLVWATGYNVIAIPLAAGVTAGFGFILSPALGAALMSVSTVVVAINAQLLRRAKI